MDIKVLQEEVDSWIKKVGVRYFKETTNACILAEEVGEVCRLIARIYGEQSFKKSFTEEEKQAMLADELADVMWVVTCLANQTGVDLTEAMQKNIQKKTYRDADRHRQNKKLM